ncbi:MAG: class I SAM-dependent methyltransferase, partial [Bacteroidia bacterium]|nr:class I SAM-dependent methyltransferase [Bacteroidia bacterium]
MFENKPARLLDIGGNTGRWTLKCVAFNPDVEVTIFDLPGQVAMAKENVRKEGFDTRVKYHESNILDPAQPFPKNFDAIWMSQFLDCFSDEQIISILKRCHEALNPDGSVFILEPFWDKQ